MKMNLTTGQSTTSAPSTSSTSALYTPDVSEFMSVDTYRTYDVLIGLILLVCFVIGLPGNLASFIYFSRRKDFAGLVYSLISGIDTVTCLIHIPVMLALFNGRKPGVFANRIFCVGWNVVFYFQARISMFLVMSLSVSRTIAIVLPFNKVEKPAFLFSCALYSLYLFMWYVLIIFFGGKEKFYDFDTMNVYCYYDLEGAGLFGLIEQASFALSLGIPPIITLISFIISVNKLIRSNIALRMSKRNRQASITLTVFTGLFLICNLPCFLNNAVYMAGFLMNSEYPRPFYMSTFMFFYSWVLAEVLSVAINAALNPVLYICRIQGLRIWIVNLVTRGKIELPRPPLTSQTQQRTYNESNIADNKR